MERVVSALNRAANSNAVVNSFLGVVFCGLVARSWVQDQTVRALEAENEVLKKNNKQIKNTIWEWKQTLYAEASATPQKALVPLSALQAIYGDVVTPVSSSVALLRMLLEPVLPISSLVNHEHHDDLRKVLDALLLVEYSFLSPESLGRLPAKHAKQVIVTKLIAYHEAIESFREHQDQKKIIAYLDAFANSSLPSVIVKWIRNELGNELNASEPTGTSPQAFLRWLLNIENKGIKIFNDDMSKFRSAFYDKEALEQLAEIEGKKSDSDILFYVDSKGQEECESEEDEKAGERMSAAFTDAARSMQSSEQGRRKRKTKDGKKRKTVKFVKYNITDHSSLSERRLPSNDGSDLENPSSDEDLVGLKKK